MKKITKCRACGSEKIKTFLNLGKQYLSDFRNDESKPPKYPLEAVFCKNCKLVQLKHTTPQAEMYHDNYGFKSGVSDSIRADLRDVVLHAQSYRDTPKSWLDIASNDGTLLSFVPSGTFRVGVDPVSFLCEEAKQYADVVINDYYSDEAIPSDQKFDVITSVSCFYDMPDPNKFVRDVKARLEKNGVWVIQQNYLLTTMELAAVDNFCHEHLEYYTLMSLENLLEQHGLEVNEVLLSMVNGGSIRTVVSHKGTFPIDASAETQRKLEAKARLDVFDPYTTFSKKVRGELKKLKEFVEQKKQSGKTIYILAASTRGATIWQSAGIDAKQITYAVERNPAKVGKCFSAIGVPIISEEEARENKPDYMIVGPWFFADEIVSRETEYLEAGGTLVVPLPEMKLISKHP